MTRTLGRVELIGLMLLGLTFLSFFSIYRLPKTLHGANDFIQLYAGAELVGSGTSIYSVPATLQIQRRELGGVMPGVYFSRPPFYALLIKPLTRLPYRFAYAIWQILSFMALVWVVRHWAIRVPLLPQIVCWSLPVYATLLNGQDVFFVLLLATFSVYFAERQQDGAAGFLLSLCAIKAHLFVLTPVVVILHRRWHLLRGASIGAAFLVALSFVAEGRHWLRNYTNLLSNPELHPGQNHMPNIHGLLVNLGWVNPYIEGFACLIVVALTVYVVLRGADFESCLGTALIGGLLVSHHAYIQDAGLLLLAFPLLVSSLPGPVRAGFIWVLLPPIYMAVFFRSTDIMLPLTLLVLFFGVVMTISRRSAATPSLVCNHPG